MTTPPAEAAATIWINGNLVTAEDARVSPFDHGLTVGNGVFETMKVVADAEGVPQAFALGRHLRRLRRSAASLGLEVDLDDEQLRRSVRAVLDANAATVGRVRMTLTGGRGPLGSDRPDGPGTLIVATGPAAQWSATTAVTVVPWRRNEHSAVAGAKTTSYAENVVALQHAHDSGSSEALFANTAGNLCEGTGSNVFLGIGGRLLTPPLSSGCLAGITRELLLEVLDVDEIDIPLDQLSTAEEVFLTSSTRDVHPVSLVDDLELAPCPGPLTAVAATAFAEIQARTLDP
jgi:branched-chain amino acid aminotransferase